MSASERQRLRREPSRIAAMSGWRGKLVAAVALAAILPGCASGGGGEIPSEDAAAMLDTVSSIGTASASGECIDAHASTTQLRREVDALPASTDAEIKDTLGQMVSRLDEQLDEQCVRTGTSEPTTATTTELTAPAPTTAPETQTSTEESTTEAKPDTPEQPPNEGGGPQGPKPTPPGQSGGGPPGTGGVEGDD